MDRKVCLWESGANGSYGNAYEFICSAVALDM